MLLGVDVGGTFTDAVLVDERRGAPHREGPHRPPPTQSAGVLEAVRAGARARPARGPREVERFAHGMTVATNALLEGRTARTALIATAGFTDVIELAPPEPARTCTGSARPRRRRWWRRELRFGGPSG